MFLSRLFLNPRNRAVLRDLADCQALHRTILAAFPAAESKGRGAREQFGVLHRLESDRRRGRLVLYVQSLVLPAWSALPADYLLREPGLDNPGVKPVAQIYQSFHPGTVLSFRLRANPSRKIDTKTGPDGRRRHGRRVELVTEEAQLAWLTRQAAAGGFQVLAARLSGLSKDRGRRQGAAITMAWVQFDGHLRVLEPATFYQTLARGIGPGKAYGLGLLSLAPPGG